MKMSNTPALSALLFLLIAETPVLAISSSRVGMPIATLIIATTLLLLYQAPSTDIRQSVAILRPLIAVTLLPAIWLALQLVPVPLETIEHPIWRSAAAALLESHIGHISIDLGSTLRALVQYLGVVAIIFATCVLGRDRERAEQVLFALCAIANLIALGLLVFWYADNLELGAPNPGFPANLSASTALGTILTFAFIARAFERYQTNTDLQARPWRTLVSPLLLGTAGVILCASAILVSTTANVLLASVFGCVTFFLFVTLRQSRVGRWTALTIGLAVLIMCGGVIVLRSAANPSVSPLFRFARAASAETGGAVQRLLSDANWAGAGVGAYQALAATYRDSAGLPAPGALNTISSAVLGWGYLGICLLAAIFAQLFVMLWRGAFDRGRDAFFGSAAAACLVTILCESFCDASLTDATFQIFAAIVIGLGLAQTVGRQVK
jgi:hypothetical protein